MKHPRMIQYLVTLTMVFGLACLASAGGYPWRDHEPPMDFLFGNHFDTHQQASVQPDGSLKGFLYVTPTGEEIDGIPVMKHCSGETPADECIAAWSFTGQPGSATFVYHDMDHPIFLVDSRQDIPQPGAYSHFHWLDGAGMADGLMPGMVYDGYFLELRATEMFFFRHSGEEVLVMPGIDTATHVNIVGSFPTEGDNTGDDSDHTEH